MDRFKTGAIVFGCIVGAAAIGMLLRPALAVHLGADSQAVVNAATGLIVGLTAFTIGLLIAAAKTTFDFGASEIRTISAKIILLYGFLRKYGAETGAARDSLRVVAVKAIKIMQTGSSAETGFDLGIRDLLDAVLCLTPQDERQSWLKSSALSLCNDIALSRLMTYVNFGTEMEPLLLIPLVAWLSSIFLSFGIFSPSNPVTIAVLLVAAVLMTSAIDLTLQLYTMPFRKFFHLRVKPLQMALDRVRDEV